MPIAVRQLVALVLGYLGPRPAQAANGGNDATLGFPGDLSDGFLDGYTPQPTVDSRPPQVAFRRPQQADRMKRDCLVNGTEFCFGDNKSYCSSCGTCCSAYGDSNNKWCCPSGGVCCGTSCCASGQTCNNGKCYLPVQIITATSSAAVTSTQVVTSTVTVVQKVIESSVYYSTVEVTNTNAETQTNWIYVTATTVAKRAAETPAGPTTSDNGSGNIASQTAAAARVSTRTASAAPIQPRDAVTDADTMLGSQLTSTVNQVAAGTVFVTSTAVTTTTIQTTSTGFETFYQTNTVVLNAKTTVEATSTWTITSHRPVTLTVTEIATAPPSSPTNVPSSTTIAPALITSDASGNKMIKQPLSVGAIVGIAIGATAFALLLVALIFYAYSKRKRDKERKEAMTEDYAYLGTGRSDGFDSSVVARSNSGSRNSEQPAYQNVYSGPPPPSGRMGSVRKPSMVMTQIECNERGLPPVPAWVTVTKPPMGRISPTMPPVSPASTQAPWPNSPTSPTSPMSTTAAGQPFGSDIANPNGYGRAAHVRSGSAQTTGSTGSSTFVGGSSSTRTSMRSNSGKKSVKKVSWLFDGLTHTQASSGADSGILNETPTTEIFDDNNLIGPDGDYSMNPFELQSIPTSLAVSRPDPPSPALQPKLGPLRVVNMTEPINDSNDDLTRNAESASKPAPRAKTTQSKVF